MINAVEKIQQGIRQIVNTVEQITNQVRSYLKVTLSKGVKNVDKVEKIYLVKKCSRY